jgi:C-terminal processing protease CtpA/Prc
MSYGKLIPGLLLAGLCSTAVIAQEQTDRAREAAASGQTVDSESRQRDLQAQMREAEARLEEAARRIAELSSRQLQNSGAERFQFEFGSRPVLGITIGAADDDGPVDGVAVRGVSPGGAAFDAGLRAGDLITAINKEPMKAKDSDTANQKLLDFMSGIEEGDTLDIEYRRDGKVATVAVKPKAAHERVFALAMPRAPGAPMPPLAPMPRMFPGEQNFVFWRGDGGWGDMEVVTLSKDLGRYFGTEEGLLVIRAPSDDTLKLRDGDVIRSIDGREPTSVSHVVRILDSYQPGETLNIEIMRDKRKQTLKIDIPDKRQSSFRSHAGPVVAPQVEVRVQREVRD